MKLFDELENDFEEYNKNGYFILKDLYSSSEVDQIKEIVKNLLERKFKNYIQLFQKNEFYYFFVYRFVGGLGVPFFLQNVFPVLFNMKKINYFFSSFFGFIPGFFVFNTIGAGLNTYIETTEEFSFLRLILTPEIYFPILMFIILIILSLAIKKKFFKDVN